MRYLDRRLFRLTAKKRFELLDKDYILKKFKEEKSPVEGNNLLGNQLCDYIKQHLNELKNKETILLVDIGSAGGALTTLFALRALDSFGLINKARIIQIDVAEDALNSTLKGNFFIPSEMIKEYKLDYLGSNKKTIKQILFNQAKYFCGDLLKLPSQIKGVDICISGFTHHHMNLFDKEAACNEMEKITRSGGFIGIVDESLNYEDYLLWLKFHKNEKNSLGIRVPIAVESFISMDEHIKFLRNVRILNQVETKKFYCFSGIRA